MARDMAQVTAQAQAHAIGGAPGQHLVQCNRCLGTGIATGVSRAGKPYSGVCYACKGTGFVEAARHQAYLAKVAGQVANQVTAQRQRATTKQLSLPLQQPKPALPGPDEGIQQLAQLGWVCQRADLPYGVELLARHRKAPGRTLHVTWPQAGDIQREWLDGPPSRHKEILSGQA